jgi:hypothetical protein
VRFFIFLLPAVLAAALFAGASASSAQTVGPTDNDLFASYCVGISQLDAANGRDFIQEAKACRLRKEPEGICHFFDGGGDRIAAAEAMLQRAGRYLYARGYGTNRAMNAAIPRLNSTRMAAEQDYKACSAKVDACSKSCERKDTRGTHCLLGCYSKMRFPVCAKVDRCRREDALP